MTQVSSLHHKMKKVKPPGSRLGKTIPRATELIVRVRTRNETGVRVPDSMSMSFYITPCHLPIPLRGFSKSITC